MIRFFLSISLVAFLGVAAFAQSYDAEKYRVYDAVIAEMFAGNKVTFDTQAPVRTFVINDITTTSFAASEEKENWERARQGLPKLTNELIQIYESNRKPATKLEPRFALGTNKYVLVDHSELGVIWDHGHDWWKAFYEKYPDSGGFITFSNVAFNKDGGQALVYFVHWCGPLCGTGHYLLLNKKDGIWSVVSKAEMWIS